MKITGTVDIINRLAQSTGFGASSRLGKPCKGVLQVRNRADGRHVIILSTNKEISAHEFYVKNIQLLRTRFVKDGCATIEISQPPMNIMLRNCDPAELRTFIDGLNKLHQEKKVNVPLRETGAKTKNADPTLVNQDRSTKEGEAKETPGSLRKGVSVKRCRSPELSKTETVKIKKSLSGSDRIISVRSRANYPKEVPPTIEQIKILEINLQRLDRRMLKLKWLNYLDLSGNCFKDADELAKLNCDLKVLILANNGIPSLPDGIFNTNPLRNLLRLDLSNNVLTKVPSSIVSLRMLTDINISGNGIMFLPYNWMDMKKLRTLKVSKNKLLFVPATILNLQLTTLDMSENPDMHRENDSRPDYVGYSSIPTLFETACEVFMNMQRKKSLPPGENLPSIVETYLQGGKYCIECGKMSLKYKIIKDFLIPSSVSSGALDACVVSPALTPCLVKKIICYGCDISLPSRRVSRII